TLGPREIVWIGIGFLGQFLFMMRSLWQWIQSERQRRSIIPIAFWYFSLAGGMTLFAYAVHRRDPVFITGQSLGLVVYTRNLLLMVAKNERVHRLCKRACGSAWPRSQPGTRSVR